MESNELYQLLEKIIFNEEGLDTLKSDILKLEKGTISSKQLREQFLKERIRMLEDITDFFPFYAGRLQHEISEQIVDTPSNSNTNILRQQIQEREELLELIGTKLHTLTEKFRLEPYLEKAQEIYNDAEKAMEEERYEEFIRLIYLYAEKYAKSVYISLFNSEPVEKNERYLTEMIKKIQDHLQHDFGIIDKIHRWRLVRNEIAHNHIKIDRKTALNAQKFFTTEFHRINCLNSEQQENL